MKAIVAIARKNKVRLLCILLAAAVVAAAVGVTAFLLIRKNRFAAADINCICADGSVLPLTAVEENTYLFLPSSEDGSTLTLRLKKDYTGVPVSVNGVKLDAGKTRKVSPTAEDELVFTAGNRTLTVTVASSSDVPSLFITTESGSMTKVDGDKDYRESGFAVLTDSDGTELMRQELTYIKGRGNQTWRFPKKPYNIKLEKAAGLLGMGEAREWSLIANYLDQSAVRNKLIYDFARELGFAYTPRCEYVNLWLNGSYAGLYLLMEKVEISPERLDIYDLEEMTEILNGDLSRFDPIQTGEYRCYDIKNDPLDITEGYVIELEDASRAANEPSWFRLRDGTCFAVKTPKYVSAAQMEYIRSFVQSLADALDAEDGVDPATGKRWDELMDAESFAKKYIVEEVSGNKDSEWSSQYFYLSGGKLCAGPVWDYDHTLGNGGYPLDNPETLIATWRSTYKKMPSWYGRILAREEFGELVRQLYREQARPIIDRLGARLSVLAENIAGSTGVNDLRWPAAEEDATRTEQTRLAAYITARAAFLDRLWIDEEELIYVYFEGIGVEHYYSVMVPPGTTLADIGDTGLGFSLSEAVVVPVGTDTPTSLDIPLTEDCGFYVTLQSER